MGDSLGFWQLVSHILVSSLRPEPYTLCLSGEHCLLYALIMKSQLTVERLLQ